MNTQKIHGKPARIKLINNNVLTVHEATIAGFWVHAMKDGEHMSFPAPSIVSIVWLDL